MPAALIQATCRSNSIPDVQRAGSRELTTRQVDDGRNESGTSRLRGRLLRGLGATALGPIATAAVQLVTVPCLLHFWGAAKYGDWLILSAIPSYLGLSDLGFGDASGSDMTMRVASGDRQAAIETFQSSWVLLSLVSLLVAVIAATVVWRLPWQQWVRLTTLSDVHASAVVLVLGIYVLVSQQCGILESGFRCDGNFAAGNVGGTLIRVVESAAGTIIGVLTGSLLCAAAAYLISRVGGTLAYGIVLRKKNPWLSIGFSFATFSRIKELAAPAFGFIALPLANAVSIQGFTLLIASVLGSVAVAEFSTLRTLSRVNVQLTTVIAWALWPELSRAFGAGNLPLARTLHRHAYQAGLALSVMAASALCFFGPALYSHWIRNALRFEAKTFHILLLVTLVNSLWFTSSVVPMSANAHHRITLAYVALSLLSICAGRILLARQGLNGAAIALLLIEIPMTYLVLRTSLRQLQQKLADFLRGIVTLPLRLPLDRQAEHVEQHP
jgi:O-antigen/teichoic acid export membrane protein